MRFGRLSIALLSALCANQLAAEEPAFVELRVLSPQLAHRMVLAATQDCAERGYRVSAAVVDRNGILAAFLRDPLSGPHTVKVSQQKAYTSATTRYSTAQLSSRPNLNFAPDILLIVGGLPIKFNGYFYGGIAVAGATPVVDEKCAGAGIEAVSDIMNFVE